MTIATPDTSDPRKLFTAYILGALDYLSTDEQWATLAPAHRWAWVVLTASSTLAEALGISEDEASAMTRPWIRGSVNEQDDDLFQAMVKVWAEAIKDHPTQAPPDGSHRRHGLRGIL